MVKSCLSLGPSRESWSKCHSIPSADIPVGWLRIGSGSRSLLLPKAVGSVPPRGVDGAAGRGSASLLSRCLLPLSLLLVFVVCVNISPPPSLLPSIHAPLSFSSRCSPLLPLCFPRDSPSPLPSFPRLYSAHHTCDYQLAIGARCIVEVSHG